MPNTLQDTANYITPFGRYQSPNVGTNNMPMLGIGNIVRSVILAAPMTWRFNRAQVTLTGPVVKGTQDYTQQISGFGFLEKAIANDGTDSYEFTSVKNNDALSPATKQGRPMSIAVQSDDGAGNITFRLSPVPDGPYTITLVYQKGPGQFANMTGAWAPIPDAFSDIYNNMSLGYYLESCQDPRGPQYTAKGIASLLARADGLSMIDRAVFMQTYMNINLQQLLVQLKAQQTVQAQSAR